MMSSSAMKSRIRRTWGHVSSRMTMKRWIGAGAAVAVVAAGAIVGVPAIASQVSLANANTRFDELSDELSAAMAERDKAVTAWTEVVELAAVKYTELHRVVDVLPASFVTPESRVDEYAEAVEAFAAAADLALTEDGALQEEQPKYASVPVASVALSEDADLSEVKRVTGLVERSLAKVSGETDTLTSGVDEVADTYSEAVFALDVLSGAAADKGAGLEYAKASDETVDALAAAVKDLTLPIPAEDADAEKGDEGEAADDAVVAPRALTVRVDRIQAYVDAVYAASDSHEAAKKKEAEEKKRAQERARGGGGGNSGGGGGGSAPPSNGGGNGGGGYTPPSNGGNGGGNSGGGGGGSTPPSSGGGNGGGGNSGPGPRGGIVKSGAACQGTGGSSSGNWASNLVAPFDAKSVWVSFENPGSSWGIAWECDMGWN